MSTGVVHYRMNPAEDTLLMGEELREGMWVLPEFEPLRSYSWASEEEQLRGERFCRIIRPPRTAWNLVTFIGEWVDGYQRSFRYNLDHAWIVKKDSIPGEGA